MSEEEKKAIEELSNWRKYIIKNRDKVNRANDIEFYLRTVLNLITKQQEEIEIHKDNYKVLSADITQVFKDLGLSEETIIADEMVIEIKKKFISKDKIREINKEIQEKYNKSVNDVYQNPTEALIEFQRLVGKLEILKELLED